MKHLIEKYEKLKLEQVQILAEKEIIRSEFEKFAKFKIGDKVEYGEKNYKDEVVQYKKGIIRTVFSIDSIYSDNLLISYYVGKITKSGNLHKNQNIYYMRIPESELKIIEAV